MYIVICIVMYVCSNSACVWVCMYVVKGYRKAAPVQQATKKQQDVKTTGTGNTKDELSNMYGL